MMKTKQGNNVTDHIDAVYTENGTERPWSIRLGAIFDENQIGQRRDWSYKSDLQQKRN